MSSSSDDGPGSLRSALQQANHLPGADVVRFGESLPTIQPLSPLPTVTDTVVFEPATTLVRIDGAMAGPDADGLRISAPGRVQIRGVSISNFSNAGVRVFGGRQARVPPADSVELRTNTLVANGTGVVIENTAFVTLSGDSADPAVGNLIERNAGPGVVIRDSEFVDVSHARVQDNGGPGVRVLGPSERLVVHGNRFASNGSSAVEVHGEVDRLDTSLNGVYDHPVGFAVGASPQDAPRSIRLNGNVWSDNGLAIDLGSDGPTPNDAGDEDTGPNRLLNHPVITSAVLRPGPGPAVADVAGTLAAEPSTKYGIDLYAGPSCSSRNEITFNPGAGANVVTNTQGRADFNFELRNYELEEGLWALTIGENDDTSEFSPCVPITQPGLPDITASFDRTRVHATPGVAFSVAPWFKNIGDGAVRGSSSLTIRLPDGLFFADNDESCTYNGQTAVCTSGASFSPPNSGWQPRLLVVAKGPGRFAVSATASTERPDPNPANDTAILNVRASFPQAQPLAGEVLVIRRDGGKLRVLKSVRALRPGSIVNARRGRVKLRIGATRAVFKGGVFRLSRDGEAYVQLRDRRPCRTRDTLEVRTRGALGVVGRAAYVSSERGRWRISNACAGTRVSSLSGEVSVTTSDGRTKQLAPNRSRLIRP